MDADAGLGRRVTRLENETESIYELLGDVRQVQDEHTRRLDGVDTRLEGIDTSPVAIQGTLTEVLRRLD